MIDISIYDNDWDSFRLYIENKAKNRCVLTNKNWLKLRDIHLEMYLKDTDNPFEFLIKVKLFYPSRFHRDPYMRKYYELYKQVRENCFNDCIESQAMVR